MRAKYHISTHLCLVVFAQESPPKKGWNSSWALESYSKINKVRAERWPRFARLSVPPPSALRHLDPPKMASCGISANLVEYSP
jgi:hypothetical protein